MSEPVRFLLSEPALAAARSGDLPQLQALGLAEDGASLLALRHAVGILDSAGVAVVASAFAPGETAYRRLKLTSRQGEDDFVATGGSEEIHDLVWLGDATNAAMHLASFLGLVFPGPEAPSRFWEPSRDAWETLLLLVDATAIQQRRAELGDPSEGPMTIGRLETLSATTDSRQNTRWAAFAASRLAPGPGHAANIAAGLDGLKSAGLLAEGTTLALTPAGEGLVATLNQALLWGQLLLSSGEGDGTITTIRSLSISLLLAWNGDASAGTLSLHSGPSAVLALHALLADVVARSKPAAATAAEPAPTPQDSAPAARFCASCGNRLSDGARFCASCGKPVT